MHRLPKCSFAIVYFITILTTACQAQNHQIGSAEFTRSELSIKPSAAAAKTADLNNDGHIDLVFPYENEDEIGVFLGNGTGEFEPMPAIPAGGNPNHVALGDINDDATIDIVLSNHETLYTTILLGDESGNFAEAPNSPININVDPHPHMVEIRDLNEDGVSDLLIDHRNGNGILVLPGKGAGEFDLPGKLVVSGGDPYLGFAVGDIDNDGDLDLAIPHPRETVVLENTGAEELEFTNKIVLSTTQPFGVALLDINNDSNLDLISVSGESTSPIEIFIGNGDATFAPWQHSPIEFERGAKRVVAGDFNGDGIDDAVICNYIHPELLIILGGNNDAKTYRLPAQGNPWGLAAADFNEDGIDDIVISDFSSDTAILYLSVL